MERSDGRPSWLRPLQAATALRHMLRAPRAAFAATGVGDDPDSAALRRNELALLQHHLERLLASPRADLRAAGELAPNPSSAEQWSSSEHSRRNCSLLVARSSPRNRISVAACRQL